MLDGQLGWIEDNGSWYYLFLNGQMAKRWEKITGEWYYFYSDGSMAWGRTVDGYFLDIHGKCISREGWQKNEKGTYYYVGPNEKAVTGWNRIDGEFYYFYSDGSMTYSNTVSGFYLNSSGKVSNGTGWLQDGMTGDWYYYSNGEASNGWVQDDNGSWYYTDDYGRMVTGWVNDNGVWYFLYDNGSMAHNYTEGGYHVDLSGKMVTGSGWIHVDSWWYYLDDTGKIINNWLYNEGNWYYLYPEGSMAKGWIEEGDSWYYLNNDGSMAHNTKIDGYYVNDDGEWEANKDFIEDNIINKVTNGAAAKVTYNGNEAIEDDSFGEIITSVAGTVIRKFKDINEFFKFELLMGLGEKNGGDIGVIYVTDEDEQLANVGADMLTGELAGDFVAIIANGVRAYKNVKTGEIVYNDGYVGSGAGNIKKQQEELLMEKAILELKQERILKIIL